MKSGYLDEMVFDSNLIDQKKKQIDLNLKSYIENNILPEYQLNDGGHNCNHINYVLNRAIELADSYDLDYNILYVCVMFHDIACHIDRDNHEKLSSERVYNDEFIKKFFNTEDRRIIKEAVEDHRASLEYVPRNIYGKILSSADRKVEIKVYLVSSMSFSIKKYPELTKNEVINQSYDFAIKKFGKNGYAIKKSYVVDKKYKKFLDDLQFLIDNKDIYFEVAGIVYDEMVEKI